MVEHGSIQLQSDLVRDVVLPNIAIFGPLVYAIEVAIAVSLILGLLTRVGALLGALMAVNLWLGLYNAPGEWPWTYMFLVVIQLRCTSLAAQRNPLRSINSAQPRHLSGTLRSLQIAGEDFQHA